MNDPKSVATPVLKKRVWPFPVIWLVPIFSAVAAGLYLRDYFAHQGPEIVVEFADASGIRVGEAKVLYRGAEVGKVTDIELSDNHKRALVHVQLDQQNEIFATKSATFWVVRPEVSESGFTGLATLFSGPYIAALPGKEDDEKIDHTEGLSRAPRPYEAGEKFVLTARRMGHVQEGSGVSYKGIQVGSVQKVELAHQADHLDIEILIWTRYAALVRENTKFWISSGFDVEAGLFSGLHMKLDSLKTLTSGGITFATPDKDMKGPAKGGASFAIEEDPKREWELWSPKINVSPRRSDAAPAKPEALPVPKKEKN